MKYSGVNSSAVLTKTARFFFIYLSCYVTHFNVATPCPISVHRLFPVR